MTQREALELLHLDENATQQQIIEQYKEHFNELNILIEHAPDVYLKKQYQKKLVNIVHAYNFLTKGQTPVSEDITKTIDEKSASIPGQDLVKTESQVTDKKDLKSAPISTQEREIFTAEKEKKKTKALIYTLVGLLTVIVLILGVYFIFFYKSTSTIKKEIDEEMVKLKNAKSKREADSLTMVISIRRQLDSSKKILAEAFKEDLQEKKPDLKKRSNQVKEEQINSDNIVVNIFNNSNIELQVSPYSNGSIITKIYGQSSKSMSITKDISSIYIWSCKLKGEDLDCEWKPYQLPGKGEKLDYEVEGNKFMISR